MISSFSELRSLELEKLEPDRAITLLQAYHHLEDFSCYLDEEVFMDDEFLFRVAELLPPTMKKLCFLESDDDYNYSYEFLDSSVRAEEFLMLTKAHLTFLCLGRVFEKADFKFLIQEGIQFDPLFMERPGIFKILI